MPRTRFPGGGRRRTSSCGPAQLDPPTLIRRHRETSNDEHHDRLRKVDYTALGDSLEEYLRVRRSVGYKLVLPGWLLSDFVAFCDTEHSVSITTDLALRWATLPSQASSGWWRTRLSAVRVFARCLSVIDPATQVPPPDLLPGRTTRVRPYLFCTADIDALLAAGALTP